MKNIIKKIFFLTMIVLLLVSIVNASEINDDTSTNTIEETASNNMPENNIVEKNANTDKKTNLTKNSEQKNIKTASNQKVVVDTVSYDANNASLLIVKARQINTTTNKTVLGDWDIHLYVNTNNHTESIFSRDTNNHTMYFYYRINNTGKHNLILNSSNFGTIWSKNITINKLFEKSIPLKFELINYSKTLKSNESFNFSGRVTDSKHNPMGGLEIDMEGIYDDPKLGIEMYYFKTDENGIINGTNCYLHPGKLNITLTTYLYYSNRSQFNLSYPSMPVTVTKRDIPDDLKLIITEKPAKINEFGNSFLISGYVSDKNNNRVIGVPINFTTNDKIDYYIDKISGINYLLSDTGGYWSMTIEPEIGKYNITFQIDDSKYNNKKENISFEILPAKINISLGNIPSTITNANVVNITARLYDKYGDKYLIDDDDIIFEINGKKYPAYGFSYNATCSFYVEKTGNYTVKATCNQKGYEKVSTSKKFTVKSLNTNKIDAPIYLELLNMNNKTKTVTYNILTGSHYYNVPLVVKINNYTEYIDSGHGWTNYNYTPKENGVYNISVAYNTTTFKANKANSSFTIKNWYKIKDNITIKANPINLTSINKTTLISGTLYNQNNKTVANTTVKIQDGTFKTEVKTNNKGYYSYNYTVKSGNGTHNVTITVPATDNNNQASITQKFKCRTPTEILINYTQAYVNQRINITVTIKNPLNYSVIYPNAKITVKVANITYNKTKTNKDGNIPLNYSTTKEETINVIATFAGSNNYDPSNKTIKIKIIDYTKSLENKIKEYEQIMKNQNNTIKSLNTTIKNKDNTIKTLNNTIKTLNNTINNQNKTINNQNKTINNLNTTIKNKDNTIKSLNDNITNLKNQIKNITTKLNTKIILNKVIGSVGKTITISANVLDQNNKKVNEGFVLFKVNDITLKDKTGNSIFVPVTKGVAKFNYEVPRSWIHNATNLKAIFTETQHYKGCEANKTGLFNISNGTVKIKLANMTTHENGDNTQFVVTVTDLNDNPMNGGRAIIKVNGITLKDAKNKTVEANVVNGIAIIDYKIAIGARNHNITAVYAYTGYNRAEASNTLKVIKAEPFIRYTPITTKSNKTIFKATVVDKYKSLLYYPVTFVMSINGKNYNTTTVKGNVNITIPTNFKKGVYRVSMAVYETGAFKSDKLTSVLIKE